MNANCYDEEHFTVFIPTVESYENHETRTKAYVCNIEATQWRAICAARKMQGNLTTDTICQNLLLHSVTSKETETQQWRKRNWIQKHVQKGIRQRHSLWFRLTCNAKKQGGGGRWCRKTSNWPLCGFFQTLAITLQYLFDTVCLWKWNHDKSVAVKRNPKEVALLLCAGQSLSEEAAIQRFTGQQDGEDERETKEEIKRRSNHVG